MGHELQAFIDAPLGNACKTNLPAGKRGATRRAESGDDIGFPKVSRKELSERKTKGAAAKIEALFDYYATTELTAERVAEHMGLYRNEQTGVTDDGKPILSRVLDVKRAADQLAWRRKQVA